VEDTRFDTLAKALGALTTRRFTLGALLGGPIGLHTSDDAAAKRKSGTCKPPCTECTRCQRGKCRKKDGKKRCKKAACVPKGAGAPCSVPAGGSCESGGACGCPAGLTNCAGVCTMLETDAANCGACGTSCGAARTCCSGVCRNLSVDGANCGACGHACATNECVHGARDCQNLAANCPAGCSCGVREEGGTVCFAGVSGPACTVDTECPFRSSCLGNNFCSIPCLV
jgi:hypothetical protein